jgi:hypothetical protein
MAARTDRIFILQTNRGLDCRPLLSAMAMKIAPIINSFTKIRLKVLFGEEKPVASFLTREDILRAFRQHGFASFKLHNEDLKHSRWSMFFHFVLAVGLLLLTGGVNC